MSKKCTNFFFHRPRLSKPLIMLGELDETGLLPSNISNLLNANFLSNDRVHTFVSGAHAGILDNDNKCN